MLYGLLVLMFQLGSGFPDDRGKTDSWSLDKTTVRTGGCVSLLLHASLGKLSSYQVRVGDREPVRVLDAGVEIKGAEWTIVLLSHDLRYAEPIGELSDDVEQIWIPSIFRRLGEVTLSMEMDGRAIGSKQVTVVEATVLLQSEMEFSAVRVSVHCSASVGNGVLPSWR